MIERGHDPLFLMQMDTQSFDALVSSSERNHTRRKLASMWERFVSSQGDGRAVQKYTAEWEKEIGPPPKGAAEFLANYGKGI